MSRLLPSYLNTLRMQWGLSQPELADLLGIGPSLLSKLESLTRRPTAKVIVAAEVVFGLPAREIFPGAYSVIETEVVERVGALQRELEQRSDPAAEEKQRRLKEVVNRTADSKKGP